jgi:hypothetical protein
VFSPRFSIIPGASQITKSPAGGAERGIKAGGDDGDRAKFIFRAASEFSLPECFILSWRRHERHLLKMRKHEIDRPFHAGFDDPAEDDDGCETNRRERGEL